MAAFLDYVGTGSAPAGGHYRMSFVTGNTIGFTANQAFLCFKWKTAGLWLVLMYLKAYAVITTAFGTAQKVDAAVWFNRGWSTDPSGGTTITFTTPQTMRDSGGSTMTPFSGFQVSPVVQVATTGALTTGTRVQDAQPMAYAVFGQGNTLGNAAPAEMIKTQTPYEHPPVFGTNEGFELTVPTAQGATGTVGYYVDVVLAVVNNF